MILVDALDEALPDLGTMLANELKSLPRWIALFVTSRADETMLSLLKRYAQRELYCSQEENLRDVSLFLHVGLKDHSRSSAQLEALVETLMDKCKGQFLHARLLLNAVTKNPSCNVDELPSDLSQFYADAILRIKKTCTDDEWNQLWWFTRRAFRLRLICSLPM